MQMRMSNLTKICLYFKTLSYTAICNRDHVCFFGDRGEGACAFGVKGGGGGAMLTVFLVFLGQGYFPFQSKAFFFTTIRNGKGVFLGRAHLLL